LQCVTVKCITVPLHHEISIIIMSVYCVSCLQCSVNRIYIIIVFFSNTWVSLIVDVLCAWSTIRLAASNELFLQGSAAILFGLGWRVYNFLIWNFLRIIYTKIIIIGSFFSELFKIWGGGVLRHSVDNLCISVSTN